MSDELEVDTIREAKFLDRNAAVVPADPNVFVSEEKKNVPEWQEYQDEDGNTYYYNSVTGKSQWENPGDGNTALHLATEQGNVQSVKTLLSYGADVSTLNNQGLPAAFLASTIDMLKLYASEELVVDADGNTLLHHTCKVGNPLLLEYLLQNGTIPVNSMNQRRETALHVAVLHGQSHCVKELVRFGCNLELVDRQGHTALMKAILQSQVECVQVLQSSRCSPKAEIRQKLRAVLQYVSVLNPKNSDQVFQLTTSLQDIDQAVEAADFDTKKLEEAESSTAWYKEQYEELQLRIRTLESDLAAVNDRVETYQTIAKNAGDLLRSEREQFECYEKAWKHELDLRVNEIEQLQSRKVDQGFSFGQSDSWTTHYLEDGSMYYYNAETNQSRWDPPSPKKAVKLVKRLSQTEEPEPVDRVDAVWNRFFENVAIRAESKPLDTKEDMRDIMLGAVVQGNVQQLENILAQGASPDLKDEEGRTALHIVCTMGNQALVPVLCEYGGNIEALDNQENTPLHCASQSGRRGCIQFLLETAANVNAQNNDGDTPMHLAAWNGHLSCVHALYEYGADSNSLNNYGQTPYGNILTRSPLRHRFEEMESTAPIKRTLAYLEALLQTREDDNEEVDEDEEVDEETPQPTWNKWFGSILFRSSSPDGTKELETTDDEIQDTRPPTDAEINSTIPAPLIPPDDVLAAMAVANPSNGATMSPPREVLAAMELEKANRYSFSSPRHKRPTSPVVFNRYVDTFNSSSN